MSKVVTSTLMVVGLSLSSIGFADSSDAALFAKLSESKLTLLQGLAKAEANEGAAISAKFEMDGDHLSLSVYTAKKGFAMDAEHNVLRELAGDPTGVQWTPGIEVFADTEHLTRASSQLTLMQLSHITLSKAVAIAARRASGIIYSVTPKIEGGHVVVEVLAVDQDGDETETFVVNLSTGAAVKR